MVEKEGTSHALGDVSLLVPVLKRVAADKISDRFCNGFAPKRVMFLSIRSLLSSYRVAKLKMSLSVSDSVTTETDLGIDRSG